MAKSTLRKEVNCEIDQEEGKVVFLTTVKLSKLKQEIKQLRQRLSKSKSAQKCKKTCHYANILIGDLNDEIKQEGRG